MRCSSSAVIGARVVPQERAARPRRLSRRILDAINSQQSRGFVLSRDWRRRRRGRWWRWRRRRRRRRLAFLDSRVAAFLVVHSLLTFRCRLHVETRLRSCAVSEYKPARRADDEDCDRRSNETKKSLRVARDEDSRYDSRCSCPL